MAFSLYQPAFLHEVGKRANNEDAIYPIDNSATREDRLFLVCDGVGGANKGEVASRMCADLFKAYFTENPGQEVNSAYINNALKFVEAKLSEYVANNPECSGMATTLTLIYFDDATNTATVGWCGDSRVYQVRNGVIQYVTDDHSLVNELVKRGELTELEAKGHPQRNVILRAISGKEHPTKIDVVHISDIQPNDYFLLATDGILESIDDRILVTLFQHDEVDVHAAQVQIKEMCNYASKDNFSMYLLKIKALLAKKALPLVQETAIATGTATKVLKPDSPSAALDRSNMRLMYIAATAALCLLLVLGVYQWNKVHERSVLDKYAKDAKQFLYEGDIDGAIEVYEDAIYKFPENDMFKQKRQELTEQRDSIQMIIQAQMQLVVDSLLEHVDYERLQSIQADSNALATLVVEKNEQGLQNVLDSLALKTDSAAIATPKKRRSTRKKQISDSTTVDYDDVE